MNLGITTLDSSNQIVGSLTIGKGLAAAIIFAFAGLSLFLVSIKLLSRSLKTLSGQKFRKLLLSLSDRPLIALGTGVLFTTIIQSSDGSVALIIGLLAAGFISLKGAIAFILGANIGTATTSILVAFQSAFKFSLYFNILFIIGAFGFLLFNKRKRRELSFVIFTLGGIFVGLALLSASVKVITKLDAFASFFSSISHNIWGSLGLSVLFTALFQSSSATVTIYQTLYIASVQAGNNLLPLATAIALVFGANVGTTFTAILVALLSKSKDAGRIALVWSLSNIVITLLFTPLITIVYAPLIAYLVPISNPGFQLSVAHLLFNALLTLLFTIFIPELASLCYRLIPLRASEKASILTLPKSFASLPIALDVARKNTAKMGDLTVQMLAKFQTYILNNKKYREEEMLAQFNTIKDFRKKLYKFSIEISRQDLTKELSKKNLAFILTQRNFEAISVSIRELFDHYVITKRIFKRQLPEYYKKWKQEIAENVNNTMQLIAATVIYVLNPTKEKYLIIKNTYKNTISQNEKLIDNFYNETTLINAKEHLYETEYISIIKILERISQNAFQISAYIGKRASDKFNLATLSRSDLEETQLLSLNIF